MANFEAWSTIWLKKHDLHSDGTQLKASCSRTVIKFQRRNFSQGTSSQVWFIHSNVLWWERFIRMVNGRCGEHKNHYHPLTRITTSTATPHGVQKKNAQQTSAPKPWSCCPVISAKQYQQPLAGGLLTVTAETRGHHSHHKTWRIPEPQKSRSPFFLSSFVSKLWAHGPKQALTWH